MVDKHQHTRLAPKVVMVVHSLAKNCLVWTMVDEHQKLPSDEIGPKRFSYGIPQASVWMSIWFSYGFHTTKVIIQQRFARLRAM